MTHQEKIDHAKELIYAQRAQVCVLLCSFGKDSMTLLHLIREVMPLKRLSCHGYPIPVIYHRQPWFPAKNEFADRVIRSWGLEIHDYPPLACGVKCKADRLELVGRYPFGNDAMDLPLNTEPPIARRPYLCGRQWLLRPKAALATFPWHVAFHGHKSTDVDPYEGPVPLRADQVDAGGVHVVFPLREWTDADVWEYLEEHRIEYDLGRYQNYQELEDKWNNPDYIHACTACIDPRETAAKVYCPKLQMKIPNVGHEVARLEKLPHYIEKE
jgi:hypothetical protein